MVTDENRKQQMKKRMKIMLISLAVLFGAIFLYKVAMHFLFEIFVAENKSPLITVSAMKVEYSDWQPQIKASASLRAIQGVNVTTEIGGLVQKIYFVPGSTVTEGTVLVQLNADPDVAQLHSLQANAQLAQITYDRDKAQLAVEAVSQQQVDTDLGNLRNLQAQVEQQAANVAKKTIRAPFSGRLGISEVNPGQYLNPGDKIVSLQTFDPIYADFYVPQQQLSQLSVGQKVTLTTDANQTFIGKVTTIDPAVDTDSRNAEIEATIPNPDSTLTPGMYAYVLVDTGKPQRFLTLPQTAISYNPYGNIVYIVKDADKDKKAKSKKGKENLTVIQSFVTTGDSRGDQVAVLKGLKEGDMVVTSGQLKLKNGSRVTINNSVMPTNNPAPKPVDE